MHNCIGERLSQCTEESKRTIHNQKARRILHCYS